MYPVSYIVHVLRWFSWKLQNKHRHTPKTVFFPNAWILEKWPPANRTTQPNKPFSIDDTNTISKVYHNPQPYNLERSLQLAWVNAKHSFPLTCLQSTFWCQSVDCRQVKPFHTPCDTLNFGLWCMSTVTPLFDVSGGLWGLQMAGFVSPWQKIKKFWHGLTTCQTVVQVIEEWPTRRGKWLWYLIHSYW